MMLSIFCHAMPSLKILQQALSILLWLIMHDFLQATKSNCQISYVFSDENTLLFSMMKTVQELKFIAFVLTFFFYKLAIERKIIVLNIEH